jgi:hypothetical protein
LKASDWEPTTELFPPLAGNLKCNPWLAAAAPLSSWPLLFAWDAKKKSLTFHEPVRFVLYEHAAFADPLARRGFQTCTHIAGQLDTEPANDVCGVGHRIVNENWHGAAIILEEECRRLHTLRKQGSQGDELNKSGSPRTSVSPVRQTQKLGL